MNPIPAGIGEKAYRASNGEYAWRREDLPEALHAIAGERLAALGGEFWAIVNNQITGLIPGAKAEPPGVWSWDTSPRNQQESWAEYCVRTAEESIKAVEQMDVEAEVVVVSRLIHQFSPIRTIPPRWQSASGLSVRPRFLVPHRRRKRLDSPFMARYRSGR